MCVWLHTRSVVATRSWTWLCCGCSDFLCLWLRHRRTDTKRESDKGESEGGREGGRKRELWGVSERERGREGEREMEMVCTLLMLKFSQQGLFMHFIWGRAWQSVASAPCGLPVCMCVCVCVWHCGSPLSWCIKNFHTWQLVEPYSACSPAYLPVACQSPKRRRFAVCCRQHHRCCSCCVSVKWNLIFPLLCNVLPCCRQIPHGHSSIYPPLPLTVSFSRLSFALTARVECFESYLERGRAGGEESDRKRGGRGGLGLPRSLWYAADNADCGLV